MSEGFPGLGDRIRRRLKACGYWRRGRPDVPRFCTEKGYRPQYVYAWLDDRIPSYRNLQRLAQDLEVSGAWLMFGAAAEGPGGEPGVSAARGDPASPVPADVEAGGAPATPILDLPRLREVTDQLVALQRELDAILQAFPDLHLWLDREGRILSYKFGRGSASYLPPAAFLGKPLRDIVPPEVGSRLHAGFLEAFHGGDVVSVEYRLPFPHGLRTREARFVSLGTVGRSEPRVLVIVRDMTERAQAEAATRALVGVGRELTATLDIREATTRTVTAVRALFRVARAILFRQEPESGGLRCVAATDDGDPARWIGRFVPSGVALAGRAIAEKRPVWSRDTLAEPDLGLPPWLRDLIDDRTQATLAAPMIVGDRVQGVLVISDAVGREFTADEMELLAGFGHTAALALDNAWLYTETQQRRAEAESLARTGRAITSSLDPREVAARVVDSLRQVLRVQVAALWLAEPETGELVNVARAGDPSPGAGSALRQPARAGIAGRAVAERRAITTRDALNDPDIRLTPEIQARVRHTGARAGAGVPLVVRDRVLGALTVGDQPGRAFGVEDVRTLEAFADQAAIALENARLYAETQQRQRVAESLARTGRAISATLDPREVSERIVQSLLEVLEVESAALWRLEPATQELVTVARAVRDRATELGPSRRPVGTALSGRAVAERRPVTTINVLADPAIQLSAENRARLERGWIRAMAAVPLFVGDRVIGALSVGDRLGRVFGAEAVQALEAFAAQAASAVENAQLHHEARQRRAEAEALTAIGRSLVQSLDPRQVAERIVESVLALRAARAASLWVAGAGEEIVTLARAGDFGAVAGPLRYPAGDGLAGLAMRERRMVATRDILEDPQVALPPEARARIAAGPLRVGVAIPLVVQERVIGALSIADGAGRVFSEEDLGLLSAFADQAAAALEHARLYAEVVRRRAAAECLAGIGHSLVQPKDLALVSQRIVDGVLALLEVQMAALFRVEAKPAGQLRLLARAGAEGLLGGEGHPETGWVTVIPPNAGISGLALRQGRAVWTADILDDPRVVLTDEMRARIQASPLRSALTAPLVVRGHTLGTLSLADRPGRVFTADDVALVEAFADQAALLVEQQP